MGRARANRPQRLAEKLRTVRLHLQWTQEKMYAELKAAGANLHPGYVSLYESDERVPSLLVLLAYSRVSKISMEIFADDKLELPGTIAA